MAVCAVCTDDSHRGNRWSGPDKEKGVKQFYLWGRRIHPAGKTGMEAEKVRDMFLASHSMRFLKPVKTLAFFLYPLDTAKRNKSEDRL